MFLWYLRSGVTRSADMFPRLHTYLQQASPVALPPTKQFALLARVRLAKAFATPTTRAGEFRDVDIYK